MRFLIYVILAFIAYQAYKSARAAVSGSLGRSQREDREPITAELVEDPICHTYCPKTETLKIDSQGKTFYFCSEECRDKFLEGR